MEEKKEAYSHIQALCPLTTSMVHRKIKQLIQKEKKNEKKLKPEHLKITKPNEYKNPEVIK